MTDSQYKVCRFCTHYADSACTLHRPSGAAIATFWEDGTLRGLFDECLPQTMRDDEYEDLLDRLSDAIQDHMQTVGMYVGDPAIHSCNKFN